jgi:hypothetical protein
MYLGRYSQGDYVLLSVWTRNANGTPLLPDSAPVASISQGTQLVQSLPMPIRDRFAVVGFFQFPLLLGTLYTAGQYRVLFQWTISGTAYADVAGFEVVGVAGHPDGAGLAMIWYARPTSNFVLVQTESGRIIRRRNPRL